MQTPSSEAEESVFTRATKAYFTHREKDWVTKARVQRWINWTLVVLQLCSIGFCGYGIMIITGWSASWNSFISHERQVSEKREEREIAKARMDSTQFAEIAKNESIRMSKYLEKARSDSIMAKAYMRQMNHYDKIPDHKGD
jgi:hypothetical protein